MFSLDFRKTPAWDYQRRPLRPRPTDTFTFHLGSNSVPCGHRLRHVGTDYGKTKKGAHITTESLPTSERNQVPTSNGITCPHQPEYAVSASLRLLWLGCRLLSMRGDERVQDGMFSYVTLEQRVPADHPLREIGGSRM